jgi:Galactose oxidase, central domain
MTLSISRSLRTLLTSSLLVSMTFIAAVMNSAAQTAPGKGPGAALMRWHARHAQGARLSQPRQVPASTPTWNVLFPGFNDPDLNVNIYGHSAVYDSGSNTMIVFGGVNPITVPQNNVLLLTNANGSGGSQGGAWSELGMSFVPPARTFHSAVYDQTNNRMIVFGGCADGFECLIPLNDVWVLSNANGVGGTPAWTQLSPSGTLPSPRAYHNAVYDATNNRMIVYSGAINNTALTDVWVLSNANGLGGTPAWTQLSPTGSVPDAHWESTAVYDPTTNVMIVFGGGSFANSVWTLSNANGLTGTPAWTNLIANGAVGAPKGRVGAQAIYDSASNRMTIFGGNGDFGYPSPDFDFGMFNDVWVLANANGSGGSPTWTQLHPKWAGDGTILPGTRTWFTALRDSGTNSMIIFGGANIEAVYGNSWVLSHANGL